MKKFFTLIFATLSIVGYAQTNFVVNDCSYEIISSQDMTVKLCRVPRVMESTYTMPSTVEYRDRTFKVIETEPLIRIWGEFKTLVIPEGIETLASQTFNRTKDLEDIYFPSIIKSVGDDAFTSTKRPHIDDLKAFFCNIDFENYFN